MNEKKLKAPKSPNHPTKPYAPTPPCPPEKTTETASVVAYIQMTPFMDYVIPEGIEYDKIRIGDIEYDYNDNVRDAISFLLQFVKMGRSINEQYEEQYATYLQHKKIYDLAVIKYKIQIAKYKEMMVTYNKDYAAYTLAVNEFRVQKDLILLKALKAKYGSD